MSGISGGGNGAELQQMFTVQPVILKIGATGPVWAIIAIGGG